jgi:hypothetical protein
MAGLYAPGAHSVHELVPLSYACVPLGHCWHDNDPDVEVLVPGSHGMHDA